MHRTTMLWTVSCFNHASSCAGTLLEKPHTSPYPELRHGKPSAAAWSAVCVQESGRHLAGDDLNDFDSLFTASQAKPLIHSWSAGASSMVAKQRGISKKRGRYLFGPERDISRPPLAR